MTNQEYVEKWKLYLKLDGKAKSTIKTYSGTVEAILFEINKEIKNITRDDMIEYLSYLHDDDTEPATINKYISSIQALYNFLFSEHGIENITIKLPRPSLEKKEKKILTKEQMNMIINSSDLEYRCYSLLGYEAAIRISEVLNLEVKDIDFGSNEIHVRKSKRNKSRRIPMSNNIRTALAQWISENGIKRGKLFNTSRNTMGRNYEVMFEELGLKWGRNGDYTFHSKRHSGITRMVHSGIDLKTVSDITGTTVEVLLKTYVHSSEESKRKAISVFNEED